MTTYRAIRHHHDASAIETFEYNCLMDALDNAACMCCLSGVAYVEIFRGDVALACRIGKVSYDEAALNDCGA